MKGNNAGKIFLQKINIPFKHTNIYLLGFMTKQEIMTQTKKAIKKFFILSLFDTKFFIIYNKLC